MKLATWNVNSLKETKSDPDAFPQLELEAAGYQVCITARVGGPAWRCWPAASSRTSAPVWQASKGPKPSDHAPLLCELRD